MPPPMPNPSKRITANPIRPARYRPGKVVPEDESSDEEEEEEEKPQKSIPQSKPRVQAPRPRAPVQQQAEDDDEDDDEEGFVTDDDDEPPKAVPLKTATQPSDSTLGSQAPRDAPASRIQTVVARRPTKRESEEEDSDEEESEAEESSEEESSSEDEAPQRKFQRPTFIKKADRQKSLDSSSAAPAANDTNGSSFHATSSTPEVDEQARRLAQADLLIKDKLERDARARAQGRKAWDDDEELDPEATVDDTDNLDPAAEHAAWKLRELRRLKRDREAIEAREREIEELERRRNLTQEEREREDKEYLDKQKEEHDEGRSKANYLAKYHHKGAFFQDDEMAQVLKKRDVMGARFQDEVSDKSALPEYMRIRDMTKLGKKGRTRYTDLRNEDTGRFGEAVKRWKGAGYERDDGRGQQGGAYGGVDERFLPDRERDRGPTGANASAVGQRRETRRFSPRPRSRSRSKSPRRRRDSRDRADSYRPSRRRSYSRSRSRSRSRTPPRRKRSPSPYGERDKRRRIEVD